MPPLLRAVAIAWILLSPAAAAGEYYPPHGAWESLPPGTAGFDAARLQEAVDFAVAQETRQPRDLALSIALDFAAEPYDAIIGPAQPRGAPTGLVIRHGYVVASWGEPDRVDMTFSVTKSFLSTVVGLAQARGLIEDLDEPVAARVPIPEFAGEPNARITWDQLLRQTSGWRGTLWGKPDWADRPTGTDRYAWPDLPVPPPGEAFEYNDVRVNALALAALHLWKEPLPEVLAREVMQPIGASDRWRWHGYDNSWVDLGGRRVQSVSGGGHWGGGMFIDAWDMARFGLLWLRRGQWADRQVLPEDWVDYASTPTPQNPEYGVMNWFVNRDRTLLPSAPAEAVAHLGNGANAVYVDPVNDLVVVVRWIRSDQLDAFIGKLLGALAR
jgi:CubicO group peptidase (beta-lactamase class C family)